MQVLQIANELYKIPHKWKHEGVSRLLQTDSVKDYVLEQCRLAHLEVYILVDEHQGCLLCSRDSSAIEQAIDLIENNLIIIHEIKPSENNIPLLLEPSLAPLMLKIEHDARNELAIIMSET